MVWSLVIIFLMLYVAAISLAFADLCAVGTGNSLGVAGSGMGGGTEAMDVATAVPANVAAIILILLAIVLFIAEIVVVSHGMLATAGVVSFLAGIVLLFRSSAPWLAVSAPLIAVAVAAGAFLVFALGRGLRENRKRATTGAEGLVGEAGIAETDLVPDGKVVVHGEYWDAWSDDPVHRGERVVVVAVEGLRLKVGRKGGLDD